VLAGPNGQGKTNFLEACYLLATLRPLRAQRLAELVRFGAERARATGRFLLAGGEREVEVTIEAGKRIAKVDGKAVRDPTELFGGLAVVAFAPDELAVVRGGPEARRKLLDRAVQNRHPDHMADARDYLRALKSRNQLLRDGAAAELIEAFDAQLSRLGARIRLRRESLLGELRSHAGRAFAEVARGEAELVLRYDAAGRDADGLGSSEDLPQKLLVALQRRLPRDRERGFTSVGPHADDLWLGIGERPARLYASQGQARAVMLAFKIGEIENLRAVQGRAPLLLLDDVSSELDPERNRYLMQYLRALEGQVVLTTTDPELVRPAVGPQARFLTVSSGQIETAEYSGNSTT
jgi:DNA replication and repair protein RecF